MYQLITIPGTCSTGIHVLLNKLNVPFEVVKRDDIENYQALVPTNQVPALQTGESLITEGAAIVLYLADQHGVDLNRYGSKDIFRQWLMFNYATLHPAYSKLFTVNNVMADSDEKHVVMQALADRVADTWKIVDQRLSKQPYMTGDIPTVIDYLLAIYLNWGNYFPQLKIPVGENVLRLVNEVSTHQEFVAAFENEGATFQIPSSAI